MGSIANVAVLPANSDELRIEEIELPDPEPHQVVVRQFASGICHSQLHTIHSPRNSPVLLGHESTGVVEKVGKQVDHVREGDIVVVTWVPRDSAAADSPPQGISLPVQDGIAHAKEVFTWADITIADAQFVVKVDPDIDREASCIVGCAVMTGAGAVVNTAAVEAGNSVAIFGVGGVGLCAVAAAKVAGASPIIAVDLDDKKLEFAKQFGASHTINSGNEDPVRAIRALTVDDGAYNYMGKPISGADHVFDCIGVDETMKQVVAACRKGTFGSRQGGTAVYVGLPTGNVEINPMDLLVSEKTLRGSFCGSCVPDRDIPRFLNWSREGKLDMEALITRRFRLEEINMAVSELRSGKIFGRAIIEF